jgi:hypothetical protein
MPRVLSDERISTPHINLLLPSTEASGSVDLEIRIYLPTGNHSNLGNEPTRVVDLDGIARGELRSVGRGLKRLIVASHPWGKLGGNMLDPYVSVLHSASVCPET